MPKLDVTNGKILLFISGDGAGKAKYVPQITKNTNNLFLKIINISDDVELERRAFMINVGEGKEDGPILRRLYTEVFEKLRNCNSITIEGKEYPIERHYGGDYSWILKLLDKQVSELENCAFCDYSKGDDIFAECDQLIWELFKGELTNEKMHLCELHFRIAVVRNLLLKLKDIALQNKEKTAEITKALNSLFQEKGIPINVEDEKSSIIGKTFFDMFESYHEICRIIGADADKEENLKTTWTIFEMFSKEELTEEQLEYLQWDNVKEILIQYRAYWGYSDLTYFHLVQHLVEQAHRFGSCGKFSGQFVEHMNHSFKRIIKLHTNHSRQEAVDYKDYLSQAIEQSFTQYNFFWDDFAYFAAQDLTATHKAFIEKQKQKIEEEKKKDFTFIDTPAIIRKKSDIEKEKLDSEAKGNNEKTELEVNQNNEKKEIKTDKKKKEKKTTKKKEKQTKKKEEKDTANIKKGITAEELRSYKNQELSDFLHDSDLPKSGNKAQMVDRILKFFEGKLKTNTEKKSTAKPIIKKDEKISEAVKNINEEDLLEKPGLELSKTIVKESESEMKPKTNFVSNITDDKLLNTDISELTSSKIQSNSQIQNENDPSMQIAIENSFSKQQPTEEEKEMLNITCPLVKVGSILNCGRITSTIDAFHEEEAEIKVLEEFCRKAKQNCEKIHMQLSATDFGSDYFKDSYAWYLKNKDEPFCCKIEIAHKSRHYSTLLYLIVKGETFCFHFDSYSIHEFNDLCFIVNEIAVPQQTDANICGYYSLEVVHLIRRFLEKQKKNPAIQDRNDIQQLLNSIQSIDTTSIKEMVQFYKKLHDLSANVELYVDSNTKHKQQKQYFTFSDAEEEKIYQIMNDGEGNDTICASEGHTLSRHFIWSLLPDCWINDEIINCYCRLLKSKFSKPSNSLHYFSTFLYYQLTTKPYAEVQRWTNNVNIFDYQKIFIPINLHNSHWTLAVLNLKEQKLQYYDSFYANSGENELKRIQNYFVTDIRDKCKAKGHPLYCYGEVEQKMQTLIQQEILKPEFKQYVQIRMISELKNPSNINPQVRIANCKVQLEQEIKTKISQQVLKEVDAKINDYVSKILSCKIEIHNKANTLAFQDNSNDCGVYVSQYLKFLSQNIDINKDTVFPDMMFDIRKKMILEISSSEISDNPQQ